MSTGPGYRPKPCGLCRAPGIGLFITGHRCATCAPAQPAPDPARTAAGLARRRALILAAARHERSTGRN